MKITLILSFIRGGIPWCGYSLIWKDTRLQRMYTGVSICVWNMDSVLDDR